MSSDYETIYTICLNSECYVRGVVYLELITKGFKLDRKDPFVMACWDLLIKRRSDPVTKVLTCVDLRNFVEFLSSLPWEDKQVAKCEKLICDSAQTNTHITLTVFRVSDTGATILHTAEETAKAAALQDLKEKSKITAFISQPMRGLSVEASMAIRSTLEEACKRKFANNSVSFIDSFIKDTPTTGYIVNGVKTLPNFRLWYLGKSIELLASADLLVQPRGAAKTNNGCAVERLCAEKYGIPVLEI